MVKSDSREKEDDGVTPTTKESKESIDDEIFNIVSLIVQWYLVLDQIRYERSSEAYFTDSRPKCQCAKARDIVEKCTSAKHDLSLILKNQAEKKDRGGRDLQNSVSRLMTMIDDLGGSLRANISIRIPARLSSSSAELRERACSLVMMSSVPDTVKEAMEGVVSSVEDLFNTEKCDHKEDDDRDNVQRTIPVPLTRVGDLGLSKSSRGRKRKMSGDEKGDFREPKKFRAARKSMEEEEDFRPFKPPQPKPSPDVLNMLEKKKKLVKKNGLLQFVLWREAYKGERDRCTEMETRSAKKFMAMARRRKRSPFVSVRNKILEERAKASGQKH